MRSRGRPVVGALTSPLFLGQKEWDKQNFTSPLATVAIDLKGEHVSIIGNECFVHGALPTGRDLSDVHPWRSRQGAVPADHL